MGTEHVVISTSTELAAGYSIHEHRHRYSAWAASRAASIKTCRFSVLQGKNLIETVGLNLLLQTPDHLPAPEKLDAEHRRWRNKAIEAAGNQGLVNFSHGIAAKLINVYLKGAFVCATHETHPNVAALHPPIDSLLLDELHAKNIGGQKAIWAQARKQRWSNFSSDDYERITRAIRAALPNLRLWKIEAYWKGFR